MEEKTRKLNEDERTTLALIAKDIEYIKADVREIKKNQEENYVTRTEFDPIKRLVYGVVGIFLTGVVAAILGLVIIK